MSHALTNDITQLPTAVDGMMQSLERLARDPAIPTERITELFRLAERREQAMLRRVYFTDMNAMQAKLTQITRDKPNPAFHSRYATEAAIDAAARPVYTDFGFSITFGTAPPTVPGNVMVTCTVAHRDGYHETHALEGPVSVEGSQGRRMGATPIQAVGSTVTYLRRILIRMVLNLVTADDPEDNDGNPPQQGNGNRDPMARYIDWTDRFEQAAQNLQDSEQAKELLERETVVKMLTEMPAGEVKRRFMQIRQDIERKWLQPVDNAPENQASTKQADDKSNEIEGL